MYPISPWVPVVFGIITPIGFSTNGILVKHLVGPKVRFDTSTLAFTGYFVVNVIVIIFALIFWSSWGMRFDLYLFWLGLAGSIINTLGIVCAQIAVAKGPAGPASALSASGNILLTIIEAFKHERIPTYSECMGLVIGIFGALILVIPHWFENVWASIKRCFCCRTRRTSFSSFLHESIDYS
jgi:drug/metabolite transporter (DMT)-like permease